MPTEMPILTWGETCLFCHKPICRGLPKLIFSTEVPQLLGLSHSTCCATKYSIGQYQICPPQYLSSEQVSFLISLFPKLYSLPGGFEPNRELRHALVCLLGSYPESMQDVMGVFTKENGQYLNCFQGNKYDGDLETDYLRALGQIQAMASKIQAPGVNFEAENRRYKPTLS